MKWFCRDRWNRLGRGRWKRGPRGQGQCICPQCGHICGKPPGQPCYLLHCPNCGATMARRFSPGAPECGTGTGVEETGDKG